MLTRGVGVRLRPRTRIRSHSASASAPLQTSQLLYSPHARECPLCSARRVRAPMHTILTRSMMDRHSGRPPEIDDTTASDPPASRPI